VRQRASLSGVLLGWITTAPPDFIAGKPNCPFYSSFEWKVEVQQDTVVIHPQKGYGKSGRVVSLPFKPAAEIRGVNHALRTAHGWLLGIDHGEFGGGLWWTGPDGSAARKLLPNNVHGIVSGEHGALVLTGLAHMGLDQGKLYLVEGEPPANVGHPIADLAGAPHAFTSKPDGSILVVTNSALVDISPAGSVKQLHQYKLNGLYPNSIVLKKDGTIYIGMRFFVLLLVPSPKGYEEQWLIPASCRKTKLVKWSCECLGN
jgi:hypothetical protein